MKFRVRFKKIGPASFLGHLELINVLKTGFRRAGLPLKYSQGFHPHPKLSFGKALSVGLESESEFCDLELVKKLSSQEIEKKCAEVFPQGIIIDEVREISSQTPAIEDSIKATSYEISGLKMTSEAIAEALNSYLSKDNYPYQLQRKKKTSEINLKDYIADLALLENSGIRIQLLEKRPMVKVQEVIQAMFGLNEENLKKITIKKQEVELF